MESFEDDDTHYCIKCHSTIHGLENYVRHRQSGCRYDKPAQEVSYPEILNADAFFSSLELKSSAKAAPRSPLSNDRAKKTGRLDDSKIKSKEEKSPDDCHSSKEKPPNLLVPYMDDPTGPIGIPSLVGFPDIVTSSEKAGKISTSTSSNVKIDSYSGKHDAIDRKSHEESTRSRQDHQEAWFDEAILHTLDGKDLTRPELSKFEFEYHHDDESEDSSLDKESSGEESFCVSDDTEDRECPPKEHTGGKWKPGSLSHAHEIMHDQEDDEMEDDRHPSPLYSWSKWKPFESTAQHQKSESEHGQHGGQDGQTPPPGHTRGKWVPSTASQMKALYDTHWCIPCDRKFATSILYHRHLLSDLHTRRSAQDIDGDLHLPKGSTPLQRKAVLRRKKTLTLNFQETVEGNGKKFPEKRSRKREKVVVSCEMCYARVRRAQMGKHLLSHYHCRVSAATPFDAKSRLFILENMGNIVRQCPFQCAPCRFYFNTEETFLLHWRSAVHMKTVNKMSGPYKCNVCNFFCENSNIMEEHLLSQVHRDAVSAMNGSVPVVIGRQKLLSCITCNATFRYNIQLRLHKKQTAHDVERSASDEYQKRINCEICDGLFRTSLALQRHQLHAHKNKPETPETKLMPYFCSFCSLNFETSREAVSHRQTTKHKLAVKASKNPRQSLSTTITCKHCEQDSPNLDEYRKHMLDVHPTLCYRCSKCGMSFAISQDVTKHSRKKECTEYTSVYPVQTSTLMFDLPQSSTSTIYPIFSCNQCVFSSESQAEFLSHEALHKKSVELGKYECPLCNRLFRKTSLVDHMRVHTGERPFSCTTCNSSFARRLEFNAHLKMCSSRGQQRERNHVCSKCNASFYTKYILNQHMQRHTGKRFKCAYAGCPTAVRSDSELKAHCNLVHSDCKRLLNCSDCEYTTASKIQLRRHVRKHQLLESRKELELLTCPYDGCNFRTTMKSHVKRHMRTHTDIKPYTCRHCSYASNNLENLRKHVLSTKLHPGKMIYECSSCDSSPYCTNFSKELKAHLLEAHQDKYPSLKDANAYVSRIFDVNR